jgi:hypothetical protein
MPSFAGVDLERVRNELDRFVVEAAPENGSGNGFITTTSYARCGRLRAIELVERLRPILDALYPDWRGENAPRKNFEFAPERDAAMRLIARIESYEEIQDMLGSQGHSPQLSAAGLHADVWGAAVTQWSTGHRHEAVLAAAKAVNRSRRDQGCECGATRAMQAVLNAVLRARECGTSLVRYWSGAWYHQARRSTAFRRAG